MSAIFDDPAARRLFTQARTHSQWQTRPVPEALLRQLYDLLKCGPTSMNTQPPRIQFVVSEAAKVRLMPCLNEASRAKSLSAPVVAILEQDMAFPDLLPRLPAHKADARAYCEGKPDVTASTALRNSSLQGGYLIMAARLLGLDCGPMAGFNAAAGDRAFWTGTAVRSNFLCKLGSGDATQLKPRVPRLDWNEVCQVA